MAATYFGADVENRWPFNFYEYKLTSFYNAHTRASICANVNVASLYDEQPCRLNEGDAKKVRAQFAQ